MEFVDLHDESIASAICALARAKTEPKDLMNILSTMRLYTPFEIFKIVVLDGIFTDFVQTWFI